MQQYTDPATGRPYTIDPATGQPHWLDTTPPPAPTRGRTPAAQQPARGARRWLIPTATGIIGLVVGTAAGGGDTAPATIATTTTTATATVTRSATAPAAPAPASTKAPTPAASIPGDGTYLVGTDIKPGTYRSGKPDANCYWARLKNESGGFGAIIANNNSSGQSVVTIKATDKVFETSGCADWVKVR